MQQSKGRLRRWASQLLDGENRWGFVRVQIDRFGVTRYSLVLYPPGLADDERRQLRIWRGAPIWGAALWVLAELILAQFAGPWAALTVSTGAVIALVAMAFVKAGRARSMVRAMCVMTVPGHTTAATIAARDRLQAMALTLTDADERLDEERLSPLAHEVLWWRVYEQLTPAGGVASVRKTPQ